MNKYEIKAKELVDGFKNIDIEYNDSIEGNCFMTMTKSDAKQCALIAVDELIANEHLEAGDASFWEPVKDELLKM
jgi:hypothetical protein